MSQPFNTVRGMRDIVGENARQYHSIIRKLSDIAISYGYSPLETPLLEYTSLFQKGIGDETDVVGKEMFTFVDRSGHSVSLRPEGTSSAVRALITNSLTQNLPQKWFYYGPMFRYDRPQKGRFRQFYQFGLEFFGSDNHLSDIELICLIKEAFATLQIPVAFKINTVGDEESRADFKLKLVEYLSKYENDLSEDSVRRLHSNPLRILDSKSAVDQEICSNGPKIQDSLSAEAKCFFEKVRKSLQEMEFDFIEDSSLVRGLDYYDHTVFEFVGQTSGLTLCGGGRYNRLVGQFGGPRIPAVGCAFGIDRLILEGASSGAAKAIIGVIGVEENDMVATMKLSCELHIEGVVTICPMQESFSKRLKYCDKVGALCAFILGGEERKQNKVKMKILCDSLADKVLSESTKPDLAGLHRKSDTTSAVREFLFDKAEARSFITKYILQESCSEEPTNK